MPLAHRGGHSGRPAVVVIIAAVLLLILLAVVIVCTPCRLHAAYQALNAGIAAAAVDAKIGDISAAIGAVGRSAGYGLSTDFGGHGIGRSMHESPSVPNEGKAGRGMRLRPGLVVAIEPWFVAGGADGYRIDDDGWTLRSADGSRAAHVEHTVAITTAREFSPAHDPPVSLPLKEGNLATNRPPRCTSVPAVSGASRPSRYAVAPRTLTPRPRRGERQL